MTKEYLTARLQEAAEEGWEKALATYEDDIAEGIEESVFLNEFEEQYYLHGIENQAFWSAIEEHEEFEDDDNGLTEPINPYII